MLTLEKITPEAAALIAHADRQGLEIPILGNGGNNRKMWTDKQIKAAQIAAECCALSVGDHDATTEIAAALGPELFTIVVLVLGFRWGMEKVEKTQGIPSRSCKVLLSVAFDQMAHRGLV